MGTSMRNLILHVLLLWILKLLRIPASDSYLTAYKLNRKNIPLTSVEKLF